MSDTIKVHLEVECGSCKGTGLYCGFAEGPGVAVVCHTCDGSGKSVIKETYKKFTKRKSRKDVKVVVATNPGIGLRVGDAGISYAEWKNGVPFDPGTEARKAVCPAWWYQSADYKKKPDWKECQGLGGFRQCPSFKANEKCWERWDKEFGKKA